MRAEAGERFGRPCLDPRPASSTAMTQPIPPRPRKDPKRIEQLGRVRIDDYAWMKDDNWQAVLRDPSAVKADVREHLEAENAYVDGGAGRHRGAADAAVRGDEGAHQGGRRLASPRRTAPFEYFSRYELGAQHPRHLRRPRGRRRTRSCCWTRTRGPRARPTTRWARAEPSPDHALYAWAEDEQGSEYYRIQVARPGDRRGPGRTDRERLRRLRLLAGLAAGCSGSGATRTPGRPRSSAARPAAARTCWSTRSRTTACSSASDAPPTTATS